MSKGHTLPKLVSAWERRLARTEEGSWQAESAGWAGWWLVAAASVRGWQQADRAAKSPRASTPGTGLEGEAQQEGEIAGLRKKARCSLALLFTHAFTCSFSVLLKHLPGASH